MSGSKNGWSIKIPREPDFVIGGRANPYLRRWWVIPRNRWFNVYLHNIVRSDDDRAFHDHPWWNISVLLKGQYIEHTPHGVYVRKTGSIFGRKATAAHRLELFDGSAWSIFVTGPRVREWGFHCPKEWRNWQLFTNPTDGGETIGRGCE